MKSKFESAEEKGRSLFRKQWDTQETTLDFSEDLKAKYDCDMTVVGHKAQIEIKYRNCDYDTYDKWLLETRKTRSLGERYQNSDDIDDTLYITYTQDEKEIVWNLNKLDFTELEVIEKWCPRATAVDKGNRMKKVFLLPESEAISITQINNQQ